MSQNEPNDPNPMFSGGPREKRPKLTVKALIQFFGAFAVCGIIAAIAVSISLSGGASSNTSDGVGTLAEASRLPGGGVVIAGSTKDERTEYSAAFESWFADCQQASRDILVIANSDDGIMRAARSQQTCEGGIPHISRLARAVMGTECQTALGSTHQMLSDFRIKSLIGSRQMEVSWQAEQGKAVYSQGLALHADWINRMRACGVDPDHLGEH